MRKCFLCGRNGQMESHHIFGGTANRKLSTKYKLLVDLCPNCHRIDRTAVHNDYKTAQHLHEYGQRKFMREQDTDIKGFVQVFGRNFLDESW